MNFAAIMVAVLLPSTDAETTSRLKNYFQTGLTNHTGLVLTTEKLKAFGDGQPVELYLILEAQLTLSMNGQMVSQVAAEIVELFHIPENLLTSGATWTVKN
jgi:hypothetical protein